MKRIAILLICLVLASISISSANALTNSDKFDITIGGCVNDGAVCNACGIKSAGYCSCASTPAVIVNDCRGPSGDAAGLDSCALTCTNMGSGYGCDSGSGKCGIGGDPNQCKGNDWSTCIHSGAGSYIGCYLDKTASGTEECMACPESTSDKLCSFYKTPQACDGDICGIGASGPNSGVCSLASRDSNSACGCIWDTAETTPKCVFGYTYIDPITKKPVTCKFEQSFVGQCDEDSNQIKLVTVKKCTKEDGTSLPDETTEEFRDCGRAASPLPFFGLQAFLFSALAVAFYYLFFFKKNEEK